jgi:hypothetical protein
MPSMHRGSGRAFCILLIHRSIECRMPLFRTQGPAREPWLRADQPARIGASVVIGVRRRERLFEAGSKSLSGLWNRGNAP